MDSILFKVNGCTKKILVLKTSTSINHSVNRETFKTGQKREVLGERWTFPVLRPRKPEIVWMTLKSNKKTLLGKTIKRRVLCSIIVQSKWRPNAWTQPFWRLSCLIYLQCDFGHTHWQALTTFSAYIPCP